MMNPSVWQRLSRLRSRLGLLSVGVSTLALAAAFTLSASDPVEVSAQLPVLEPPDPPPAALDTIEVPLPENLDDFVKDRDWAVKLGKAFFWDMQMGSDGKVACATCHYHAGGDHRLKNQFAPKGGAWKGPNADAEDSDFPFFKLADATLPESGDNPVAHDKEQVYGSAGTVSKTFDHVRKRRAVEVGIDLPNPTHELGGCSLRQTTGRNTPPAISAVYNQRQFWDGRANRYFNGVNPDGDMDSNAKVWCMDDEETRSMSQVRIKLDHASLASQATGPIRSGVETAWNGRPVEELAHKLLSLRPLAKQTVDPTDSVLGECARTDGKGLKKEFSYPYMIKQAFHRKWWAGHDLVDDKYTHMEANFTLYWGLAINLYEATLIPDDTPVDRFLNGDHAALTASQRRGFDIFMGEGKCANCHKFPTTTGAATHLVEGDPIEFMLMGDGTAAYYDNGYYNIGVTPTSRDKGLSVFGLAHRKQQGEDVNLGGQIVTINPGDRIAVDGAFKVPHLRNIEFTGPYMHNGSMKSLEEVIEFYARGSNFSNLANRDPDVGGIEGLRGSSDEARKKRRDLLHFLHALTDERVRWESAPFDHPELIVVEGHGECDPETGIALDLNKRIHETGAAGAPRAIRSFADDCRRAENRRKQEAAAEEPSTEEPPKDEPVKDEPVKDEPVKDEPVK